MAATKTRIATGRIVLHRKGVKVIVNAGEKFDYTPEELESIKSVNPDALREPVNEDESAPEAKVPTGKTANLTKAVNDEAAAKADAKKGGSGKPADKADEL